MNKHASVGFWISAVMAGASLCGAVALISLSSPWAVLPTIAFGVSCLWGGAECSKAAMRATGMLPPLAVALLAIFPPLVANAEPPPKPQVLAYVCSADGCSQCVRMERSITRELVPQGWRVVIAKEQEEPGGAQIFVSKRVPQSFRVRRFPTTIIYRDGKEVERHVGYWSPKQLAAAYKAAEER